jgi:hypothetical protein
MYEKYETNPFRRFLSLTTETSEKLRRLKKKVEAMKTSNAAILPTGEIVDRREYPEAMIYKSNAKGDSQSPANKTMNTPKTDDGTLLSPPTCSLTVSEMARQGMKLPKGTRIQSTIGGIPTGGTHEIKEHVLESSNRVSEAFDDPRPFWCYGWNDLHDGIILPANACQQAPKPEPENNES